MPCPFAFALVIPASWNTLICVHMRWGVCVSMHLYRGEGDDNMKQEKLFFMNNNSYQLYSAI